MSDTAFDAFARSLADEVEEGISSGIGEIYSEVEFTRIVLERLADEGVVENPGLLWQEGTFGRVKYKITGFSMTDDEERLLLVTTVYTGEVPPRALSRDEILTAFQQAVRFYECSCKGLHGKIEPSNTEASDLARRIYESHDRISVVRLVLLSDGLAGMKSVDLKEAFDGTRLIVDLFGIERLQRMLGEGLSRDDILIDVEAEAGTTLPCLKASTEAGDYDAYLSAIPGRLLASIYEKYGTRLLELNVRAFLGLRGRKSVNAGLRRTILEEPGRFLAYNNGIVATVDELELTETAGGAGAIRKMRGLQIVNGGQTTASLHRARRQDSAKLDSITVPMKIIRVGGGKLDQLVASISRSANSQNTVQPADFSANDPFHVAVEELANNTWLPDGQGRWFYERARGSYGAAEMKVSFSKAQSKRFASETPKERRFSKTDLAKYLNAWDGLPQLVSFGNQKNFQAFMQSLKESYSDGFEPDATWYKAFIAKAIIFRAVQSIVKRKKFPAYQANIVAYTVANLAWKTGGRVDFDLIWQQQGISSELSAMLEGWVDTVDAELRSSAGARMPSEWAKKPECWQALKSASFELPDPLPSELQTQIAAGGTRVSKSPIRNGGLTRDDLELIEKCRSVDAATWFKVASWGSKSKAIHWKLSGIAKTVGEYAISGWERSPSAKQAKWALEAFRAAEQAGALES